MEKLITEIVRKLHSLPKVEILEVIEFVDFLQWRTEHSNIQHLEESLERDNEKFEEIANLIADKFQAIANPIAPTLPDSAISREGIYQEHP